MTTVAIVGAGAAGLMAALELKAAGHSVVVVEARERVGGRIHTVHFGDGLWANAGAEWLNTDDEIAHELVTRYRLDLTPRYGFEALVSNGKLERRSGGIPRIAEELAQLAETVTDTAEPWNDPALVKMDSTSVAQWIAGLDLDAATHSSFVTGFRGEFMVQPTELSLASMVVESVSTTGDRIARLTEGTGALPAAMAAELGRDCLRLGEAATVIVADDDGVVVETTDDRYRADAAILAMPLPALNRIRFEPAVAFPWVGQGRGGKLLVPYPDTPWNRVEALGSAWCGTDFVYESASHQEAGGGVLTAYSMDILDEKQVLSAFSTWFPSLAAVAGPATSAWWSSEPYSGTTYSAPRPGDLEALRRLREPYGRLHLAGEHTEPMFGYIESALVSGRRVARYLIAESL